MARTRKKAKADEVAMKDAVDVVMACAEICSIGEAVADVMAALPAPDATVDAVTPVEAVGVAANGAELFIPIDKLKKSPRNARKTPHSEAHIEALAASIAAKGMLQNLVVEPETDDRGEPTGFYLVTVGEGRRLAHLLRVRRKEISKSENLRCVLDTANDPHEISLDENVTREAMHPADQFEAFRALAEHRGWGAEDIAARFGVTAHVVKQRMRLGAVSPKLMQVYRDGALTLDQLMAFAVTDDHARQEQVHAGLGYNREPWTIRRDLTRTHVQANDRKAILVGPDDYMEAGGTIIRDLFTEDRGGYYADPALLDQLVIAKLNGIAADLRQSEGWKWAQALIDFPHAHGLRRVYPQTVELSEEDAAAYAAARQEFGHLTAEWQNTEDDLPPDVDERFAELEAEIQRLDAMREGYNADDTSRGGVFVTLNHDGTVRIERGFIRPEDEKPEPELVHTAGVINGVRVTADGEVIEDDAHDEEGDQISDLPSQDEEEGDAGQPLTDLLTRDLTAHRTLGLRLALGEQPDIALIAVTHALAAQTFYRGVDANVLEIRPVSPQLGGHAAGIEDTAPAKLLADRHHGWAVDMPQDVAELWDFIAGLDQVSVMALFAHCASLTVNAVKLPSEQRPRAQRTADKLATALALDMNQHWTPTVRSYFGRVTKAHILAAVREAVSDAAADRIAAMKKQPMAEGAEQLLAGTGWLPPLLRTACRGSALLPEGATTVTADFGADEPDTDRGAIVLPEAAE
jgi:ParB family chromosome partitioning protein